MRLRLVFAAIGVLVLAGLGLLRHERATAEQLRVALFQAGIGESAAAASPRTAAAGSRTVAQAASEAVPTVNPAGAASSVAAPPPVAAGVPRQPGTATANVIVQGPPPHLYGQPGGLFAGGWSPQGSVDDPELNELTGQDQQLEQEAQSLQRQLAETDDDKQRAELKTKLASALEKQFDTQQKLRELEVTRIEARVKKLRELIRKRTESRRKIIENRLEQLLNDVEGLGWSSAEKGGFPYLPQNALGMPGYSRFPAPPATLLPPQPVPQPKAR